MKGFAEEFKKFIMRGNVLDLAVGVVIGAAFGKIVTSFVSDILMPPLGLLLGKVDFSNLFVNFSQTEYATLAEAKKAGAPTLNYGLFLNAVLDFLIVAAAIFVLIRALNRFLVKNDPAAVADKRSCPDCLSQVPIAAKRCAFCTSTIEQRA